ncbi:MAG: hypothetical protein HQL41_13955 [Alphaproteobacteria bacterium]|nr:hypothetical protein [Alphaproteobacteria bacterium]
MKSETDYAAMVKGLLKAELKRRGLTYDELARRLTERGFPESPENIANKISRGKFTAVFFLQCLDAAGVRDLRITP